MSVCHLSVCLFLPRGGGGGGGTPVFSYIQRLGCFLFNILNFNIFGGFQKTEYFYIFGGMKILWIFLGSSQTLHFGVFSEGQGTEWRIFLGLLKNLNMYLGCMKFLIFFFFEGGGWTVDAGPDPMYEEKLRVPPPPLGFVHQFKSIPVKCI